MPGMGLNLRELKLCIVRIHAFYLFTSRCPKYLENKNINLAFSKANTQLNFLNTAMVLETIANAKVEVTLIISTS